MTVRNCGVVYIRSNLGSQHSTGISQIRLLVGQGFGALHLSGSCFFFGEIKRLDHSLTGCSVAGGKF